MLEELDLNPGPIAWQATAQTIGQKTGGLLSNVDNFQFDLKIL